MTLYDIDGNELTEIPEGTIACANCGLLYVQQAGIEDGESNDNGWWCRTCIRKGYRRTKTQDTWRWFAEDYPEFASELKRLRKIVSSYGGSS